MFGVQTYQSCNICELASTLFPSVVNRTAFTSLDKLVVVTYRNKEHMGRCLAKKNHSDIKIFLTALLNRGTCRDPCEVN